MAKNKTMDQLLQIGAWGVGGYLFYKLGTRPGNPLFGKTVQTFLLQLKGAFSSTASTGLSDGTGTNTGTGAGTGTSTGTGTGTGTGSGSKNIGNYSGPWGDNNTMLEANPNIDQQMMLWQRQRQANGQDPFDWNAFEIFQTQIHAPDPGSLPSQIFMSGAYL